MSAKIASYCTDMTAFRLHLMQTSARSIGLRQIIRRGEID